MWPSLNRVWNGWSGQSSWRGLRQPLSERPGPSCVPLGKNSSNPLKTRKLA